MNGFKILLAAAFLSGTAVAFATERTVMQKGKAFSESEIAVKVGDTIVFVNDDNVFHNVFSSHPENKFNLGSLKPGSSTPVTFKTAGDIQVLCAMHPSMKMLVKVSN
jgi:plastocyanin